MDFMQLINQPKIFVNKCQSYLDQLGYDNPYDYARFINEELNELITNHQEGKHTNNRTLLVDDIVDSMWVVLAQAHKIALSLSLDVIAKDENTTESVIIDNMITELLTHYNIAVENNNMYAMHSCLADLFYSLQILAGLSNIDYVAAFKELCNENMSKLAFETVYVADDSGKKLKAIIEDITVLQDIFRTGKLNKKDDQGNNYPWYQAGDFSKF